MDIVTIRDRAQADLPRCVDLLTEVHRADGYPLNWPADPQRWLRPPGLLHAWVAETGDGRLAGHVALTGAAGGAPTAAAGGAPRPPAAEVSRLFVAPASRGRRVASGLLRHVRQWSAARDLDLVLEVVDVPGSAAVALYERSGWRHTGTATADWTAPDGSPVVLRRYALPHGG